MAGSNIKVTTVNLYETDIQEMELRGLSISETVREIIHHFCENDEADMLYAISKGHVIRNSNLIDRRIDSLKKQRDLITASIENLEQQKQEYLTSVIRIDQKLEEARTWERICELGTIITNLVYSCNFDIDKVLELDAPEIKEMQTINPGWSITEHIRIKKEISGRLTI